MATAGAVSASRSTGSRSTTSTPPPRRCPDFDRCGRPCWAGRAGGRLTRRWRAATRRLDEDDVRVRAGPAAPGRAPSSARRTPTPWTASSPPSTAAATPAGRTASVVTAMRARELGRARGRGRRPVGVVGDLSARRTRSPGSSGSPSGAPCCGAPPTTTTPPSGSSSPTPTSWSSSPRWPTRSRAPGSSTAPGRRATRGIDPVLCLTKADLADPATVLERLRARWTCRWWSPAEGEPRDALRAAAGRAVSVLVGHSGVGKSTLVNALVPDADRATGTVSAVGQGPAHLVVGRRAAAAGRRAG